MTDARTHVIFDFDGTIADTIGAGVHIFNSIARECGYTEITPQNYEQLRDLKSQQVVSKLGVPIWKLPFVVRRGKRELALRIRELKPFEGIKEVLETLSRKGVRLGLVTSNDLSNVNSFLVRNGLSFDYVRNSSLIFGKAGCLKEVTRELMLDPAHTYYVGDETRDIEAGRKAGFKVISVTWGANSRKALEAAKPDSLVDKPEDLPRIISV